MANEQVLTAEQVIDKARSYLSDEHIAFVEKAYLYAEDAHREQYRKSGEPIYYSSDSGCGDSR